MAVSTVHTTGSYKPLLRAFSGDALTRASAVLLVLVISPYFIPVLSHDALTWYGDLYSTIPLLLLVIGLAGSAISRAASLSERRFWLRWMIAFWMWLAVRIFSIAAPASMNENAFDLATDLLYMLFYIFLVLALETGAEREETGHKSPAVSEFGAVAFIFTLIAYFIVVPSVLKQDAYESWVPSTLLYSILDVYVLSKLVVLFSRAGTPRWRVTYGLLLSTAALWAVTDSIEAMQYIEVLPFTDAGSRWDLLWLTPFIPLLGALRTSAIIPPDADLPSHEAGDAVLTRSALWGGSLLVFAFAPALLHLVFYRLGWLDPDLRPVRDWIVLVVLVLFFALAIRYQHLLVVENLRLEAGRKLKRERAWLDRTAALQRLAGGLAHDLDNALAVIDAAAQVVEECDDVPERVRPLFHQIGAGTARARNLNEQLKTIGGRSPADVEPIELAGKLGSMLPDVRDILGPDVDLKLELSTPSASVRIDEDYVERVVTNLAINGKQAMDGDGELRIALDTEMVPEGDRRLAPDREPGRYARLRFVDNGGGMSDDVREHIFEPYFTTKPVGEGTGLGLATVHAIVRKSGGAVSVESAPGRGATFEILLPLVSQF